MFYIKLSMTVEPGRSREMCILTKDEILCEIKAGNVVIDPFSEELAGPGSASRNKNLSVHI